MAPNNNRQKLNTLGRLLTGMAARMRGASGAMPVSSRLSTWVGIVSASIGGFFGLKTYETDVAKQVDESVAKTFEMVTLYNEEQLADARRKVLSYVKAKRYCDARIIDRDLTEADHIAVLEFYDVLHACTQADLCDLETANRFFAPYANYHWPILSSVVDTIKSREQSMRADSGFGEGMSVFAATPTPAPPCDGNF